MGYLRYSDSVEEMAPAAPPHASVPDCDDINPPLATRRWGGSHLNRLLDHRFDELAIATHQNLAPRAVVAAGAGAVALQAMPWPVCAAWTAVALTIECWSWFSSRAQFLGRTVGRPAQLNYLASLASLMLNWCFLAYLYWTTARAEGAICAIVIWLSVLGFAQTFASRTPLGFAVCGVLPGLGMMAVVMAAPHYSAVPRSTILGMLVLAIAFAIAGARQTFAAGRRFHETQAQLRSNEGQYRMLADNITDVISRIGVDGSWRYISPSVEAALGYTPDEFRAIKHFAYVHPDDRPMARARLAELTESGGSCTFEYRLIRKDGSFSWMEASHTIIDDPVTHRPCEIVSTSRDINHRKALELDLMEALERAEAGAAAKADFLANMTHELRTPLNAIVGFSGVLKGSADLASRDSRHARLIHDASATLLGVVNSVLDFSKLESGAFEFDPQPFDPIELANSIVGLVEDQTAARGLYLRVSSADALPRLEGDAPRLRQVLLNLVGNALKFTATGGVEVRIEACPATAGDRQRLRLAVSDTGVGIPQDKLSEIFERFSQADASVSRRFGGTGLGLAISKRIVELMGGRIGVTSVEGQGSTFWFELDLPVANPGARVTEGETEPTDLERPLRVLLVEDNDVNRELVQVFLEPYDIEIEVAVNGVEAVEAVRCARYDIVLMDVQMPVMDGMTATRMIRAESDPATSRLPIIAMTANVLPEQVQRCLDAGMDAHIGKPINPGRLLEVLSQRTSGEAATGSPDPDAGLIDTAA